jgi:tellurite resistance protein TehA-like permease
MNDRSTSPIATLFPGYFAMVMATGIISVGASQLHVDWLADVLYVIAAVAFIVLAVLLALRIVRYWDRFVADVTAHAKGFAFLTVVAATNVLAAASIVVYGWWDLGWVLWWTGNVLWVVFAYTTLIAVVLKTDKPGLPAGINGTWFLLTVSTESVAVVAALELTRTNNDLLAFTALAAFGLGLVLYLIVMTMVFLRWTFQALDPTEADPPAWIAAGAVAIIVLAGSNLLLAAPKSPRLERVAPFLEGGHAGMGNGHVLVPAHDRHRRLAAPRPAPSSPVSPVVLGPGLPARDVWRSDVPHARRHASRSPGVAARGHAGDRRSRLGRHLHRPRAPRCESWSAPRRSLTGECSLVPRSVLLI